MNELTAKDIIVGYTYRAKRPRKIWLLGKGDMFNDRIVLWKNDESVQYDGPAVKLGHRYPTVSMSLFLKWASHKVVGMSD